MFSKMLIFSFCFLAFYGLLFATMPTEFLSLTWQQSHQDKEISKYFEMANITQYANALSFNITYPDSKKYDFGLPSGQMIEFWWNQELIGTLGWQKVFEVRHLTDQFFGIWYGKHCLEFDKPSLSKYMTKYDLEDRWDNELNASLFWAECDHIRTNVLFLPHNQTWTIGESWDNDKLNIITSYEMDWNATGISAWTVTSQLLAFQSPNLGIGGVAGIIFDTIVAIPFWVMVAIMVIMLVQSMIPFIKGLVGGG